MFKGQLVRSFGGPDGNMRQIYDDGTHLWVVGQTNQALYLLEYDGTIVKSWALPGTTGGAFFEITDERGESQGFLHTNLGTLQLYHFDPKSGVFSLLGVLPDAPGLAIGGHWLGNGLFAINGGSVEPQKLTIYKLKTLTAVKQISGLNIRRGMGYDGRHIFCCSIADADLKQIDPMTGVIIKAWSLTGALAQQGFHMGPIYGWGTQNSGTLINQFI